MQPQQIIRLVPHDAQSHGQISAHQSPYMTSALGDLNQPLEFVFRFGGGYPQFQVNRLDGTGLGAPVRKRSRGQIELSYAGCDSQRHQQAPLAPLALQTQRVLYGLLFRAASETLFKLPRASSSEERE